MVEGSNFFIQVGPRQSCLSQNSDPLVGDSTKGNVGLDQTLNEYDLGIKRFNTD